MSLILQITTGSLAGKRVEFTKTTVLAGRHPDSDLKFDATKDLDVSTRHAEFRGSASGWTVNDLGSTNGTWISGTRITAPHTLRAGEVVNLGPAGPRIEIVATGVASDLATPKTELRSGNMNLPPTTNTSRPKTEERIAMAVAKQTGGLKKMVIAMGVVVIIGVGLVVYASQRQSSKYEAIIASLSSRTDSLTAATKGRQLGLDSIAQALQQQSAALAQKMRSGQNVSAEVQQLSQRQQVVMNLLGVNWEQVSKGNDAAVGMVYARAQDDSIFGGTGFCITSDGWFVTNKHVVEPEGKRAKEVGIVFSEHSKAVRSHVVKVADGAADLAFIKLDDAECSAVAGIASTDTMRPGAPVAIIGFPLGTSVLMGGTNSEIKKTSLTAGTLSKVTPDEIQLDAFAAPGSSGSPVFDARGYVIGVVYSGNTESGGRIVYARSGAELIKNLPPEAKKAIKQ